MSEQRTPEESLFLLRTGLVAHQGHGVDYEAPPPEQPAALGEAAR